MLVAKTVCLGVVQSCLIVTSALTGRRRAANAGQKLPAEILSQWEVLRLLRACSGFSATEVRNKALIATLYRTGIKLKEVLELLRTDLEIGESVICVPGRELGLDPETLRLIELWLDARDVRLQETAPLFCTLDGHALTPGSVRQLLRLIVQRAGVEKRVHPHAFRNTYALEMLQEGVAIETLQMLLGHASLATTQLYLERLPPVHRELAALGHRRSWRAD